MPHRIHDDEFDTSEAAVRSLLADQCPQWVDAALRPLANSGTSNSMWRVQVTGADVVVRLPRTAGAAASVASEIALLPELAEHWPVSHIAIPQLLHAGRPTADYPHPWAVFEWIDGRDAWAGGNAGAQGPELVADLVEVVIAIRSIKGISAPARRAGERGGPLRPLLARLERWLSEPAWRAAARIDVDAVRRCAAESVEAADTCSELQFVHGDLIPGNLLLDGQRLRGVIDWGSAGYADPAQDLAPAWSVFDRSYRRRFRAALQVDDATWLRGRAFELEHAVGGVLYYVPRGHVLGDVMARTLQRILDDT